MAQKLTEVEIKKIDEILGEYVMQPEIIREKICVLSEQCDHHPVKTLASIKRYLRKCCPPGDDEMISEIMVPIDQILTKYVLRRSEKLTLTDLKSKDAQLKKIIEDQREEIVKQKLNLQVVLAEHDKLRRQIIKLERDQTRFNQLVDQYGVETILSWLIDF